MLGQAFDLLLHVLQDKRLLTTILISIATAGTLFGLVLPYLQGDDLSRRMKAVALERNKIRQRERERASRGETVALRKSPKAYMRSIVDSLDLRRWLGSNDAKRQLMLAGYRSPSAMVTFLFFRLASPIVLFLFTLFYVFVVLKLDYSPMVKFLGCLFFAFVGFKLPELVLSNKMQKRQLSLRRAWPDALDLMLICVESGMSVEHAFRKVATEIGTASVPLAEELTLTTAELSYLPDRRTAYDNLATRTGLSVVQSVTTALIQAERYGTPLGQALRVLAQENRDMRMMEAEKKAAKLPPMLTVPMILFFLPVLFVVIMGPAMIQVLKLK